VYSFHGRENPFTGEFEIDNNKIIGKIIDTVSMSPEHKVFGEVKYFKEGILLDFIKRPCSLILADIYYKVIKKCNNKELAGDYLGFWSFGNQEVLQVGSIESRVKIPETEISNKTSLTLCLKN